jgi:sulfatase maturation enzyme AslB (radical SAM superfamily)
MKKVAVIEYNLKDYIIETFKNHKADEYELSYFVEWKKQSESNDEYLIKSISDIKNDDYDILLIAVRENRYLSRLLTYLHDRNLTRIYVVRLFAMDKKLDFISDKDSYIDVIPERDDKPYLVHLETHVCDHCNLNCKACNNFAPFVKEPTYADLGQFENDLKNLRKLFSAIGRFFLLGGEPLLAPELCCDMIRIYRKYYPINELRILTNATLILTMKSEFWECLRENNVIIHISLYPPMKPQIDKIEQKLMEEKIQYLV